MKRILIVVAVLLVVFFAFAFFFIPNRIKLSCKINIAANKEAFIRNFSNAAEWDKWWPGEKAGDSIPPSFLFKGTGYKPGDKNFLTQQLLIKTRYSNIRTEMLVSRLTADSSGINIDGIVPTSYNPIKRIKIFRSVRRIEKDLKNLLHSFTDHYSNPVAIYGYDIQKKKVVDSILVSTFDEIKGYPSTDVIYSLIDELKTYIKKHSAGETGFPMLNISPKDSLNYLFRVAIPVDKKLPSSGNISYKWMLGGGNILITEVTGGPGEIKKAYTQIENYITDYKRIAPAIPFESLVTDRRKEPDSSKWVTRIYYPVM